MLSLGLVLLLRVRRSGLRGGAHVGVALALAVLPVAATCGRLVLVGVGTGPGLLGLVGTGDRPLFEVDQQLPEARATLRTVHTFRHLVKVDPLEQAGLVMTVTTLGQLAE